MEPQNKPSFLLDNDLSPDIAIALRQFSFDIWHIKDVQELQTDFTDPQLYSHCRRNNRVFISHDYSARKQHEADLKSNRIDMVWIRGKTEEEATGEPATWRFFKTLVRSIDEIIRLLQSAHGAIHFKISQRTGSRPEIAWAESPYDRPKGRK